MNILIICELQIPEMNVAIHVERSHHDAHRKVIQAVQIVFTFAQVANRWKVAIQSKLVMAFSGANMYDTAWKRVYDYLKKYSIDTDDNQRLEIQYTSTEERIASAGVNTTQHDVIS